MKLIMADVYDQCGNSWWVVLEQEGCYEVVIQVEGEKQTVKPIAQLIAAAPDLLEACKKSRHHLWIKRKQFKEADHKIMNILSEAIAKAELT